ncbi:MAG: ABC transporter permease [Clostridia bacterium]|nr:ABC transporter permease [Clostridia bacterium]
MQEQWTTVIKPKTGWRDINLKELWQYRDLIYLFVKRNFATLYKQTILGPLWIIIAPVFSTLISTFIFGTVAKIPSDGVPYFLFYMCGNVAWTYFSSCLTSTSTTFTGNAGIFGKVYFPRLVMPISTVITGLLNLAIQSLIFVAFLIGYGIAGAAISVTWMLALVPALVLQMALLGLGCGIIISSMTTKYRDLNVLVGFGVSAWMYITPIIYSVNSLDAESLWRKVCMINPMAPVVEIMRNAFLGTPVSENLFPFWGLSIGITFVILFIGVVMFSKVEKTFMDTV